MNLNTVLLTPCIQLLVNELSATVNLYCLGCSALRYKVCQIINDSLGCVCVSLAPQLPHLRHTHALTRATYAPYDTHTHSRAPPTRLTRTHQNALRALTRHINDDL
jgi:hypothetical protein